MILESIFSPEELDDLQKNALRPSFATVTEHEIRSKGLILFGLGYHAKLILGILKDVKIKPDWIVDNNPALDGTKYDDINIHSGKSLEKAGERYVLLAGIHAPSMSKDCLKYNVKNWILPSSLASFLYTPGELGITLDELDSTPDVKKAYDLLADEKSRLVFKDFIRLQTCCKQDLFSHYEPNQYFCKNLKDKIDYSCFIDAGAYDGDTLQIWLNNVDHGYYYGFEPQLAEYNKLLEYVKNTNVNPNIKIFTYNCGLGAETSNLKMSLTGGVSASFSPSDKASSNITSVENQVKIFKLDDIKLETKPTVIKCDVEGFELNILKGATKTITEKTTLIICVYHKRNDFFELPLYMHSLSPKAKIYMRQHYETYGETVCYAIP